MKKIKKTICFLLASVFAISLTACTLPTPPSSGSSSSTANSSSVEISSSENSSIEENTPYDDNGEYDAVIDKAVYEWDDSEGVADGVFADGATSKPYATFTQAYVDGGKVAETMTTEETQLSEITYVTGADLVNDPYVDNSIKAGVKGSHDDDTVLQGLSEQNYLKIVSKKKKYTYLTIKPDCTVEEFVEADYIRFAVCMYNTATGTNSSNKLTLNFKNIGLMQLYRCTWYEVKIPLDCWQNANDRSEYASKADLYNSLMDVENAKDKTQGIFLRMTSSAKDGQDAASYTAYISDMTLGVESVNKDLGRNFTDLTETKTFHDKEYLVNTNIWWGTTEKVRRLDESGVNKNMVKYSFPKYDGGDFSVMPKKKLAQVMQYDYLYITMFIETDNPNPIEIGVNGKYDVNPKAVSRIYKTLNTQNQILVSANKWITYKIPIQEIMPYYYAGLTTNRIYTAANVSYTYEYNVLPLFYINGDFATYTDPNDQTYGFNLYVSKIFLVKE